MLHMLGSILINRNSFGVFASLTLCVCAFNPPPIVWWILCEKKKKYTKSSTAHFSVGFGSVWYWCWFWFDLVSFRNFIAAYQMRNHNEQCVRTQWIPFWAFGHVIYEKLIQFSTVASVFIGLFGEFVVSTTFSSALSFCFIAIGCWATGHSTNLWASI